MPKRSGTKPLSTPKTDFSYCLDSARNHTYDLYLCSLLGSKERFRELAALCALDHELSKIRHAVSEPLLGDIRLTWWREAVDELFAHAQGEGRTPRYHPVIAELTALVKHCPGVRKQLFLDKLRGHEMELDNRLQSLREVERYVRHTTGSLLLLMLDTLGVTSQGAQKSASHLGAALGLFRLIETLTRDSARGTLLLSESFRKAHGAEADLNFLAKALAQAAEAQLGQARDIMVSSLPELRSNSKAIQKNENNPDSPGGAAAKPLRLLMLLLESRLKRLAKRNYDLTRPSTFHLPPMLMLKLWWAAGR